MKAKRIQASCAVEALRRRRQEEPRDLGQSETLLPLLKKKDIQECHLHGLKILRLPSKIGYISSLLQFYYVVYSSVAR